MHSLLTAFISLLRADYGCSSCNEFSFSPVLTSILTLPAKMYCVRLHKMYLENTLVIWERVCEAGLVLKK